MSFSKLPVGACGGLMGLGWLSVFWRDLTWISESWAWQGIVWAFVVSVCLFWLAWLDSLRPVNNISVLSRWIYLGGSSTKQPVQCLFALIFSSQSDRDDFLSFCFIPVSVSCSKTQHSDSDVCESRTSKPSIEPLCPTQAWKSKANIFHNNINLTW